MFMPLMKAVVGFLWIQGARCRVLRNRQLPDAFTAALADLAMISSVNYGLLSYFNDVVLNKSDAAENWEPAIVQIQNTTNLMNDFGLQTESLATSSTVFSTIDILTWTECYILLAVYKPTWDSISSVSIMLAAAAQNFDTDARSQFWSTQNITRFTALTLSSSITHLCVEDEWKDDAYSGEYTTFDAASCALDCLAGLAGTDCWASNQTCPVIAA